MRNFQNPFETRKRSFICAFSICMTVPLDTLNFPRRSLYITLKLLFVQLLFSISIHSDLKSEQCRGSEISFHHEKILFTLLFTAGEMK